ncbi:hypothetical protein [Pontimicrobium sp. MEBiC06410]
MSGIKTSKEGRALDQAFNGRHAAISKLIGKDDNRSSWWSIEDLENYIAHAKAQAKELGYTLSGIRAYEGAESDEGYTTIFLSPTGRSNTERSSGKGDIPGGDILNDGVAGVPPSANYPQ